MKTYVGRLSHSEKKKKNHFELEGWLKCRPSNSTLTKQEKRGFERKNKTLDLEIFRFEAQITNNAEEKSNEKSDENALSL